MSNLRTEKLTEDVFKDFISRYYFSAKVDDPQFHQRYFHDSSFSYAILGPNNLVIGAFGINIAWRGVGEVWFMSTDELNRYPKWLVSTFRILTQEAITKGGLHRVQMFIDNDSPRLHRWAKVLNFEFEGVMKKHSAEGKDHAVYSLTS